MSESQRARPASARGAGWRRPSRREFLGDAAVCAAALSPLLAPMRSALAARAPGAYVPPPSPRVRLNFNLDWKFLRADLPGAEDPRLDDSRWQTVSTPHTFNDVDSFRELISHGGGDRGTYKGPSWYRKHFRILPALSNRRLFLEFEGMRQAGEIFLNGQPIGLYENGVTAYGVEITNSVHRDGQENLLAVRVDNRTDYKERATSVPFEWNVNDFNPDFGGIDRSVWLHATGDIYQTLPLDCGLRTSGVYVYAVNFDVPGRRAEVRIESEIRNASDRAVTAALSVVIADADGRICLHLSGDPADLPSGGAKILSAAGRLESARFWCPDDPYLYDVCSILEIDGKPADVHCGTTGFRKTDFRGGAGTGGVYINDEFVYLKGFAQRSTDEWAGLGQAYPDWMHDYNAKLIRDCHANYVRWMHVSPQRVDADSLARYGIVQICPAGDKERDATGRQWEQRAEVMRASMIYFRNNPSILFWEAGNSPVTPDQMRQMIALRDRWDPHGGRVAGYRDNSDPAANAALTPISEYYEVMIGQDPRTDHLPTPTALFRGYSAERRDRAPLIEAEDFRDEGARRFWDDDSPPYFGFKKGPRDTYQYTSESFALAGVRRYWDYWQNHISNPDAAHAKWSGYASIYFSDSDADGRQDSSEVARVSGKVDAVRLRKQIYFAHRVMQNPRPDLHILGHWSYPAGTVKTVYVIANTDSVELLVNGKSLGANSKPVSGWIFSFPGVGFQPGALRALGRNGADIAARAELATAGPPSRIRLTPILSPRGLQADGQDVALIDVEVVDRDGQRCPADDARIDFTCAGPAVWRGGYNSGRLDSTNNLYLNTECGVNRVAIRSTLSPGKIRVTASRRGLRPAAIEIVSRAVPLAGGLSTHVPPRLPPP